jgi:hypothetical protein
VENETRPTDERGTCTLLQLPGLTNLLQLGRNFERGTDLSESLLPTQENTKQRNTYIEKSRSRHASFRLAKENRHLQLHFHCDRHFYYLVANDVMLTVMHSQTQSIAVAARSKAWTVFARSNTGIVGSNPTTGIDVCVRLFCVRIVLCAVSGIATGWSPVQGGLPTV